MQMPVALDPSPVAPAAPALPDSPTGGVAPAVDPARATAPASPDSPPAGPETATPPGDPQADQRIKDGQRKITEQAEQLKLKDTELAQLHQALAVTLQHPAFQPVTLADSAPLGAGNDAGDWIKAYREAPDEAAAFNVLDQRIARAEQTGEARALRALEERQAEQVNKARAAGAQRYLTQQVSQIVTTSAPDVPLPLFWAFKDQAHAETPPALLTPEQTPARLQWQIERALTLARSAMDPQRRAVTDAAAAAAALARTAAPSMAPGSSAPGRGGAPGGPAPSMAEQLLSHRSRIGI